MKTGFKQNRHNKYLSRHSIRLSSKDVFELLKYWPQTQTSLEKLSIDALSFDEWQMNGESGI